MANKIYPREFTDWTQLEKNDDFFNGLSLSSKSDNFGIHEYNGDIWTSGYVGVG